MLLKNIIMSSLFFFMHTSSMLVYHTIHPYIFFAMTKKRIYFLDGGERLSRGRRREEKSNIK